MAVMSTGRYLLLSTVTAAMVVWHAFSTGEQFFPSMVYLSSSKFSLAVLGNMGFAVALATYKLLLRVFLGTLRDSEVERVNDKVGQAVIETCLAMTIFREDITASFLTMFVILSFVKIFHWLVQDRVDFIETTPNVTRLQHVRIVTFTLVLLAIDLAFLHHSLSRTLRRGVSVDLLFAFEYTVQASTIVLTFVKYCLSMADMAMEGRWEGKGVAVFYLELTLDMLHLLVYCAFFAVVFSTYGIPLHLVRDLYWTFRNFQTRVRDFLRYRRLTANMDHSFPDATEEDLQRADHVCIICREEMNTAGRNKKLSCSHCFHMHCLRSWLERQQNCPICRRSVVPPEQAAAQAAAQQAAAAAAAAAAAGAGQAAGAPAAGRVPGGAGAQAGNLMQAALAALRAGGQGGAAAPGPADPAAAAAAAAAGQPQHQNLRRRRGWRPQVFGGRGGEAAAAGAAAAAAAGMPPMEGMEGGWHYQPVVAHYQQWVPAAPMAVFMPAGGLHPVQYAGQQHPEQVLQAQQAQQAAAAAAAGMMPFMMPFPYPYGMVPQQLGQPAAGGAAAPPGPTPQQHMAAAAATAAAAASLFYGGGAAGAGQGAAPPSHPATAAASAAAAAAMEAVLQGQLDALRAHQERARQAQAPVTAPAASAPAASAPAAPSESGAPAVAAAAGSSGSGGAAGAAQEPQQERQEEQAAAAEDGEADAIRRRRLERFGGA